METIIVLVPAICMITMNNKADQVVGVPFPKQNETTICKTRNKNFGCRWFRIRDKGLTQNTTAYEYLKKDDGWNIYVSRNQDFLSINNKTKLYTAIRQLNELTEPASLLCVGNYHTKKNPKSKGGKK